jgi:hypothetical protein
MGKFQPVIQASCSTISFPEPAILGERTRGSGIIHFRKESDWPLKWNAQFNLSQDSWLQATDYPTASRSFPRIAGSGNEIVPRHIVRQFQSPYPPSPRGLSRISARQVALALASRFSRMLSFQIKDMEFTGLDQ